MRVAVLHIEAASPLPFTDTPKEGFAEAVSQLQQNFGGVTARVVPYTNGRLWDPAGPLPNEPASQSTCNSRNGTAYHETYGSGVRFDVMNPASVYMQDEWSTVVGTIAVNNNVSGTVRAVTSRRPTSTHWRWLLQECTQIRSRALMLKRATMTPSKPTPQVGWLGREPCWEKWPQKLALRECSFRNL